MISFRAWFCLAVTALIQFCAASSALAGNCPFNSNIERYSPVSYKTYVLTQVGLDQMDPRFAAGFEMAGQGAVDTVAELIVVRQARNQIQLALAEGFVRSNPNEYECHKTVFDKQIAILRDRKEKLDKDTLVPGKALPWSSYEKPFLFRLPPEDVVPRNLNLQLPAQPQAASTTPGN